MDLKPGDTVSLVLRNVEYEFLCEYDEDHFYGVEKGYFYVGLVKYSNVDNILCKQTELEYEAWKLDYQEKISVIRTLVNSRFKIRGLGKVRVKGLKPNELEVIVDINNSECTMEVNYFYSQIRDKD